MKTLQGKSVFLHVFVNPGDLGKQLWAQEARTLMRFNGLNHPALPRIWEGASKQLDPPIGGIQEIAYVVVDRSEYTLEIADAIAEVRKRPLLAYRQLNLLADAIALLHSEGILHRNLSAQAIDIVIPNPAQMTLRLGRFEMSSFQANLIRRGFEYPDDIAGQFLTYVIDQGPQALAALPLEQLRAVFRQGNLQIQPEQAGADVYALGVVAFQCLIGDLPDDRLAAAFPARTGTTSGARFDFDLDGWRSLHRWLLNEIMQIAEPKLPYEVRELLVTMLAEFPANRPKITEVVDQLASNYERLALEYGQGAENREYVVTLFPDEFATAVQDWSWLHFSPNTPEGLNELRIFIEQDLRGGVLEHYPGGWAVLKGEQDREMERACYVLRGKRGAYFAHLYEHRLPWQQAGTGTVLPQVLLIRWTLNRSLPLARRYRTPKVQFRLPAIRIIPWEPSNLEPFAVARRPSWQPLLTSVTQDLERDPEIEDFNNALKWFLDLQRAELNARQYAFTLTRRAGGEHELLFDLDRDERRILSDPLLHLFASQPGVRPEFGIFFTSPEAMGEVRIVRFSPDASGRPSRDHRQAGTAEVVRREGIDRLIIRDLRGPAVPSKGWLEPAGDQSSRLELRRQVQAYATLQERPALIDALLTPISIVREGGSWEEAAGELEVDGRTEPELMGSRSRKVLIDLLDCWPIYALQGPPGTGKTTIASRAVRASLMRDPTQRILVSAQSHDSLDNLAAGILRLLPRDLEVVSVRIASSEVDQKVTDPTIRALFPSALGGRLLKQIAMRCHERIDEELEQADGADEPPIVKIARRWKETAPGSELELRDRLRRGANLVFATCAACTEDSVGIRSAAGLYDWVIVEEAAKAWPTELVIPLVRGGRWALLGDQQQLPAYRRREVAQILGRCRGSGDPELERHAQRSSQYDEFFDLFARMFREKAGERGDPVLKEAHMKRAVGRLDTQFRMPRLLGDLVRDAFYPNALKTFDRPEHRHALIAPGFLREKPLIWLNTEGEVLFQDENRKNKGEAHLIGLFLEALQPPLLLDGLSRERAQERLAILTPWKAQVDLLKQELPDRYTNNVHTVDSFQGREADIVIVSLVRCGARRNAPATEWLGFLVSDQRVNVMLSRARQLLVLVGNLAHFEQAAQLPQVSWLDLGFWGTICRYVRQNSPALNTPDLFPRFDGEAP